MALYYRLFYASSSFRRAACVVAGFLGVALLAELLTNIFGCYPVAGFWNLLLPATCIDTASFYAYVGLPNGFLDLAVALLPIREVWKMRGRVERYRSLIAILVLGTM